MDTVIIKIFVIIKMTKLRVAICLRGGIASDKDINGSGDKIYIDYKKCYRSILKHIIEPNSDNYEFDFFCHCWSYDLESEITNLYSPKMKLFEDNKIYYNEINKAAQNISQSIEDIDKPNQQNFRVASAALSLKKVIELKEQYESDNNIKYDIVILFRYDILLFKNMNLQNYQDLDNNVYVDGHPESNGEFYWAMNNTMSNTFKNLFNSADLGNHPRTHYWVKNYVFNYMNKNMVMDNIAPPHDIETFTRVYGIRSEVSD